MGFRNELMLVVNSAGNDGLHGFSAGNYTIATPASSKNALTVRDSDLEEGGGWTRRSRWRLIM